MIATPAPKPAWIFSAAATSNSGLRRSAKHVTMQRRGIIGVCGTMRTASPGCCSTRRTPAPTRWTRGADRTRRRAGKDRARPAAGAGHPLGQSRGFIAGADIGQFRRHRRFRTGRSAADARSCASSTVSTACRSDRRRDPWLLPRRRTRIRTRLRLSDRDRRRSFGFPEVLLVIRGLAARSGLTRLINPVQAMTMMLTGGPSAPGLRIAPRTGRRRDARAHVRAAVRAAVAASWHAQVSKQNSWPASE